MADNWSKLEVSAIVSDYFAMLRDERSGRQYNKSAHRKMLRIQLKNRSEGSIERKHQNISAVLLKHGQPYINGYKPLFRYQGILETEVIKYLNDYSGILTPLFENFAYETPEGMTDEQMDFSQCEELPPVASQMPILAPAFRAVRVNYLEKEQNNRSLGAEGERFAIEFERWRLRNLGQLDSINGVQWISKDKGDGLGYDILSKNHDGSDRFIEVKTTKMSKDSPIFLTSTEALFAEQFASDFYLYRVFDFGVKPKLFLKNGSYNQFCQLMPWVYKGFF